MSDIPNENAIKAEATDPNELTKSELIGLLRNGRLAEFKRRSAGSTVNLSGAPLSGTQLNCVILAGAILHEADLGEADLSEADLSDADLSRADLSEAKLIGANLTRTDLAGANLFEADLTEASAPSTDLRGTNLSRADLRRTGLRGSDLTGANLVGANLAGADLTGANLFGADLFGADLIGANLSVADLFRADLGGANLIKASLAGADLQEASYDDQTIWPGDFDPDAAGAILQPARSPQKQGSNGANPQAPSERKPILDTASQTAARSTLEPVTGHLENVLQDDKDLNEFDQQFLRAQLDTIRAQLKPEDGGSPQIIELAIAGLVEKFGELMRLGQAEKQELMQLGATEDLAERVIEHVNEMIPKFAKLGDADPEADAELLKVLADDAERIDAELEAVKIKPETSKGSDMRGDFQSGLAKTTGAIVAKEGSKAVLTEVAKQGGWQKFIASLVKAVPGLLEWFS